MFVLENEYTKATFKALGAELCSFINKKNNREYIWQAEKEIWGRHAPVLFPIVGRLKNDTFQFENIEYKLSQHGFARDMEFSCINATSSELVFLLTENEETLKKYPFSFKFFIKYKLIKNELTVEYEVQNPSNHSLNFSIGAHPGFNCEPNFSAYELVFSDNDCLERTILSGGLLGTQKETIQLANKRLQLETNLFDNDAIILENLASDYIILRNKENNSYVKLTAQNFPFYGIWTKKDCNKFICLEPWHGITDLETHNGDFTSKKGIICLQSTQKFNCKYSIEVG